MNAKNPLWQGLHTRTPEYRELVRALTAFAYKADFDGHPELRTNLSPQMKRILNAANDLVATNGDGEEQA